MMTLCLLLLTLILMLIGFVHMAATITSHFRLLYGRQTLPATQARLVQLLGLIWLLVALIPCVSGWGVQVGITLWTALLHISALLTAACLTWRPELFRWIWRCSSGRLLLRQRFSMT